MESSAHDWARMTRACVSSEKRSKNRTLSDINKGERNGREVGGALWNWVTTAGYLPKSVLHCLPRETHLPASPAVRCGHVSSFPPPGCVGEGVWAFLFFGFKILGIPSLYCLSPSCSWSPAWVSPSFSLESPIKP